MANVAPAPPPADKCYNFVQMEDEEEEEDEDDLDVDTGAVNYCSWNTAAFDDSFGSGGHGWAGMPLTGDSLAMGGFPMGVPPMIPGMQFGMPGMPPWGPMPPPPFNALTPATLKEQAEHLEAHARFLKNAARQGRASEGVAMAPPGLLCPPELSGNAVASGGAAQIPDPSWATVDGATHAPAKSKPGTTAASADSKKTTIMLRNIPNNYSREHVLELLDNEGFRTKYDFVYLPMDFTRMAGLGYAFINLVDAEVAAKVKDHFQGFTRWSRASQKVCEVSWGEPLQGLEAHIDRYRNSPVMHEEVNDKYKPVLFKDGVRQPFPPPTKRMRPPRVKRTSKLIVGNGDGVDGELDDPFT